MWPSDIATLASTSPTLGRHSDFLVPRIQRMVERKIRNNNLYLIKLMSELYGSFSFSDVKDNWEKTKTMRCWILDWKISITGYTLLRRTRRGDRIDAMWSCRIERGECSMWLLRSSRSMTGTSPDLRNTRDTHWTILNIRTPTTNTVLMAPTAGRSTTSRHLDYSG